MQSNTFEETYKKNIPTVIPYFIRTLGNIGFMIFSLYILKEVSSLIITIYIAGFIIWPLITFPNHNKIKDIVIWEDIITKGIIWPLLILDSIKDPDKYTNIINKLYKFINTNFSKNIEE